MPRSTRSIESKRTTFDLRADRAARARHDDRGRIIVQNRQLLAQISDRAKALIATYSDEHRALPRTGDGRLPAIFSDPKFDIFYGAPALIAICGKPMGVFVTADCWLAAENLMIAAIAPIIVGYAASEPPRTTRRDPEIVSWRR